MEPILARRYVDQVFRTVVDITESIGYPCDLAWKWGLERDVPHSLGFGSAGLAVFFCHVGLALENEKYIRIALQYLNDAVEGMRQEKMSLDFFGGVSGICWAVRHIGCCLDTPLNVEEVLPKYEEEFLRWCQEENPSAELSTGTSGVCLYIAEDRSKCSQNELSATVVSLLSRKAELLRTGITWRVSEGVASYVRRRCPDFNGNIYSTSIGYGVAGIIGALLAVDTARRDRTTALRELITNAVLWLLAQRRPKDSPQFPLAIGMDAPPFLPPSRGWYLGDLGIFTVLFNAGILLDNEVWKITALEVGRAATTTAEKDQHKFGTADCALCNGSAGRAHLYNRLFQATGDGLFADEARYWYLRLLESISPSSGTATLFDGGRSQSLLVGDAGIALALLASVTSVEPSWDRALLASFNKESDHAQTNAREG
jgi:lantibiotic modifying enzyme